MKIYYDSEVDVLYLEFRRMVPDDTIEIESGIYYAVDENKHLISIEILDASKRFKAINKIEYEYILPPKKRRLAIKRREKAVVQGAGKIR
jgi:uncharacterized protein YuzE